MLDHEVEAYQVYAPSGLPAVHRRLLYKALEVLIIGVDSDLVQAPFEVVLLMLECLDYSYHFLIRGCVPLG